MTLRSSRQQESSHRATHEVKAFFDCWTVYEKAMNANYFGHREAYGALQHLLMREFSKGFSLIDFGCGDASFIAAALKDTALEQYVGVELSGVALDLARTNLDSVRCDRVLIEGDFFAAAHELETKVNVIWIGLNLHHLPLEGKDLFLKAGKKLLHPGGYLIFFEPMCLAGEGRLEHAKRWWDICQRKWTALSMPEMESLRDHIFSADYPETFQVVKALARRHGFREVRSMFIDPDRLYEMVRLAV